MAVAKPNTKANEKDANLAAETNDVKTANMRTKKAAEKEDAKTSEEKFNDEVSKIPVPTSVGMNAFRQQINDIINNSSLHPECILEVLRSACTAVEGLASEVADKEMEQYRGQIEKLQKKYKLI